MNPSVPLLINQLAEREIKRLRQVKQYLVLRRTSARYVRRLSFYMLGRLYAAYGGIQRFGTESAINDYRFAVGVPKGLQYLFN
jgi:hypothetical protein